DCEDIHLKENERDLLTKIFLHIIRNSMDHGIETADERVSKRKNAVGKIWVEAKLVDGILVIRYKDDGKGLDLKKLREQADESRLLTKDELQDRNKVANIIFQSGISTRTSVTDISGRGVGMGAVKEFLENSRGSIELKLEESTEKDDSSVPFEFHISVPLDLA
ncbi:MAG: chemotaxis protein CheA, partial [Oligoflexales bacterium]|nr:chemotaxis protein CheA [Oligoflexales bacterium]